MRETQERRVVWPDVQMDTFIRFVQFAYSGNYDPIIPPMDEILPGNNSERSRPESVAIMKSRDESGQKRHDQMACNTPSSAPQTNTNYRISYSSVFLGHARLYSLAEKYRAESLKKLTIKKLEHSLAACKNYPGRDLDIVELIEYAYSDDNTPDEGEDSLRKCIVGCLVSELCALGKSQRFSTMLESGGAFARSFWPRMVQKFQEMAKAVEETKRPRFPHEHGWSRYENHFGDHFNDYYS